LILQNQINYLLIPKGRIIASRHYYKFRPKLGGEQKTEKEESLLQAEHDPLHRTSQQL
jgi:hypothetical protein